MRLWISLILLPLLVSTGCAVNPVTGKNELSIISESDEISMGQNQYAPSQQSQGGQLVSDPELVRYVQQVGQKVAGVGDRDLPYEFVVLNNGVPNAWALPGGKIAINRGLLTELNSEAELAAVLGHEVVHAAAKHGANSIQRGMILQGVVTAAAIGAAVSESEYGNYVVGGAQLGSQLISTKYGRNAELESDYYGTQYMARAGYDPTAAVSLQQTFVRLSEGRETSFIDGLFASHPPSPERVARNRLTVEELGNPGGEIGEERYKKAMAYLTSNSTAYKNFDHALSLYAKGEFDKAQGNVVTALKQIPAEPRLHGLLGNIYYQKKQYDAAEAAYARAIDIDNNYFEYHLGRGLVQSKKGNKALAKQYLERANSLLPTAVASEELGQMSLAAGNKTEAKGYFSAAMEGSGSIGQRATLSFLQLDIEDNPGRYFKIQPSITDSGYLIATITNLTPVALASISVRFDVVANGQTQSRVIQMPLGASDTEDAISGWQFTSADGVTQVNAGVVAARR